MGEEGGSVGNLIKISKNIPTDAPLHHSVQCTTLPTTHAWWQGAARHFSTHWTSKTFLMTWKCQRHVVLLHILCLWAFLSPDYKNSMYYTICRHTIIIGRRKKIWLTFLYRKDGRNFSVISSSTRYLVFLRIKFKSNCILLLKFFAKMQEAIFFLRQTV